MSHLIKFSVEGLAGSKKPLEATLNRDVNVFFGLNGSGKTSLLRIFDSAFNSDASTLANVPFTAASVVIESLQYKQQYCYTLEKKDINIAEPKIVVRQEGRLERKLTTPISHFILQGGQFKARRPQGWKVEPKLPKNAGGHWAHRYLPTSRLVSDRINQTRAQDQGEDFYDALFASELERHWNEFFGGVQGEVRRIQEQGIAHILTEVLSAKTSPPKGGGVNWERAYARTTAFLERQKLGAMLPAKKAFEERFRTSAVLQRVVERIEALEEEIAKAMEPRTKLQALVERLFSGDKRLVFGDTKVEVLAVDDIKIGLQSLSSGEKQILRILFEVLRAETSSLIIDEPELSLHIDWQRELVAAIRELNPDLQLIIATHSPEIMAELPDSKIFQM